MKNLKAMTTILFAVFSLGVISFVSITHTEKVTQKKEVIVQKGDTTYFQPTTRIFKK